MAEHSEELFFGCVNDQDFVPLIMVAIGDTCLELIDDRQFALAPVDSRYAKHLLNQLQISATLKRYRNHEAIDFTLLADILVNFSALCYALKDLNLEIDINPTCLSSTKITIVDGWLFYNNA